MKTLYFAQLFALFVLGLCDLSSGYGFLTFQPEVPSFNHTVNLLVIGDFGYLKTEEKIEHVAEQMAALVEQDGPVYEHILTVGDNLYPNGIENMNDLSTMEQVLSYFDVDGLKQLPFKPTLGNHDCFIDYQNEISYSQKNRDWQFPNDFYELSYPLKDNPSKRMVLLQLNSCKLMCKSFVTKDKKEECDTMQLDVGEQSTFEHYDWLEERLKVLHNDSSVAWKLVAMHHPFLLEPPLKLDLIPLLRKYGVDAALVGHKHQMDYSVLKPDQEIRFPEKSYGDKKLLNCKGETEYKRNKGHVTEARKGDLHQFLIGASGHKLRDICPVKEQDGTVEWKYNKKHGFGTVHVNEKTLTVRYVSSKGKVVYEVIVRA